METLEKMVAIAKPADNYPFRPLSKKQIISRLKKAQGGSYKDAGVVQKELHARYGLFYNALTSKS